jgi:ABC-type branched-subunit amino acid transport system ATPase component
MLEINNLNKSFDGLKAVNEFSLNLQTQKITGLIGPNGAGKTTVFNIITGYLTPDNGNILYKGNSLIGLSPWMITRLGISRTFQDLRLFRKLTVMENVLLARQNQSGEKFLHALFTFSKNSPEYKDNLKRATFLLESVGLLDDQNNLAENLSYGQQKLLSIACCLATNPTLLLLDEPVAGVQLAMMEKIVSILKYLVTNEHKTIFLIEHNIQIVMRISDTIIVMDEGKKILEDTSSAIADNTEILEAYLS